MSSTEGINRRNALLLAAGGVSAVAGAGGALAQTPTPSQDANPMTAADTHPLAPGWRRFAVGDAVITVVLDGIRPGEGPFPTFGEDQSQEAVGALMQANGLPAGRFVNFFNPMIVQLGGETILVDTGMGEGGRANGMGLLRARMTAAGIAPEDVGIVVLTHFHGDHINGLMEAGASAFPNARYVAGQAEMDFWTSDEAKNGPRAENAKAVETLVVPFKEKTTLVGDGDEVVPGMTARAAFGHTPGMLAFEISSGGKRLLLGADTFSQFVVSFQKPDWQVRFDQDKPAAAATRRRLAAMLADEGMMVAGYHLPFPAIGTVMRDGEAYRSVPDTYQSLVEG